MAGEIIKARAVCLAIRPWSRTSHITSWLTPAGCVTTVVKGAVRPKSAFLGQYDLNYTCEILYYARAKGELHALRECTPLNRRDFLRDDFRALALADWFRRLALDLAPAGPDAAEWFELLERSLDGLASEVRVKGEGEHRRNNHSIVQPSTSNLQPIPAPHYPLSSILFPLPPVLPLQRLLSYELSVLRLAGLAPDFADEGGSLHLRGEREIPVSADVRACLENPLLENNPKILVEAARVISVYYSFHLDCAPDVRRTVLRMICR